MSTDGLPLGTAGMHPDGDPDCEICRAATWTLCPRCGVERTRGFIPCHNCGARLPPVSHQDHGPRVLDDLDRRHGVAPSHVAPYAPPAVWE